MATAAYNFGDEYWRGKLKPSADQARTVGFGAAEVTPKSPRAGAIRGAFGRMAAEVPSLGRMIGVVPEGLYRVGAALPDWIPRGGALGPAAAAVSAVPEAIGVMEAATDPSKTKLDVGARVGEGLFRTGMTGLGAGLGAVAGTGIASIPLSIAGGYAGNWLANKILPSGNIPAASAASTSAPVVTPEQARAKQTMSGSITDEHVTVNGTRIANPGYTPPPPPPPPPPEPVRMLGAREYDLARGSTLPSSDIYTPPVNHAVGMSFAPSSPAGRFFGATAKLRQVAQDNASRAAYAKLSADYALRSDATAAAREGHQLTAEAARFGHMTTAQTARDKSLVDIMLKGPEASANAAKAGISQAKLALARSALARGASEAEVAQILGSPAPAQPVFSESVNTMPDKSGAITVYQRSGPGAGVVKKVIPQPVAQTATPEQFAADVKAHGRAATLRLYKERNITPPKE